MHKPPLNQGSSIQHNICTRQQQSRGFDKKSTVHPYTDELGRECNLYYKIEVKGHLEENNWHVFSYQYYLNFQDRVGFIFPSEAEYTVVPSEIVIIQILSWIFRVKAFTGYWVEPTHMFADHDPRLVEVESSDWSIQTITITHRQNWYLSRFFCLKWDYFFWHVLWEWVQCY